MGHKPALFLLRLYRYIEIEELMLIANVELILSSFKKHECLILYFSIPFPLPGFLTFSLWFVQPFYIRI